LEDNWVVVSEALQTVLRREGYPKPYEVLKKLTRTGQKITQQSMINFIANLDVEDRVKEELIAVTPFNYTGVLPPK
jgi:adenylosuccinate lyase